ncbi:MAG TPA: ATP-binding protein [Candidatus Acidoferrum sp.]
MKSLEGVKKMWAWRKKEVQERSWQGAARASLAGAAREELIREAIHSISRDGRPDRIGVWLEQDSVFDAVTAAPARFRGIVWEAGGDEAPEEWQKLSLESPLPQELLASGQSVYQEVGVLRPRQSNHALQTVPNSSPDRVGDQTSRFAPSLTAGSTPGLAFALGTISASSFGPGSAPSSAPSSAMIGPLVGLRHALWTPIEAKGRLRGLILTGSHRKQATLPAELAESVAAELALALEFEQEQRLARERHADVALAKRILSLLGSSISPDTVLTQLAASCTEVHPDFSGAGASFAVIGQHRAPEPNVPQAVVSLGQHAPSISEMDFAWESGDSSWTAAVEREPLASLWRGAVDAGHVLGTDPPAAWCGAGMARLVAIPLLAAGETLGVLVAGISQKSSLLATLERLEVRASLAVSTLERRKARAEQIRRTARRQALLEFSPEATVLLDARGNVASLNRRAKDLLQQPLTDCAPTAKQEPSAPNSAQDSFWSVGARFAYLFCAREQAGVETWVSRTLSANRDKSIDAEEISEAELVSGVRVRLQAPLFAGEDLVAVVLAPAAAEEAAQQRGRSEAELQNVLEWVEEGILLFGGNHSIRAMNTRFAQIAGLAPQDVAACTTLDSLIERLADRAVDPDQFAKRWRELARGAEGGTREELQLARPVPRVLERSVRPVLDHAGRRLGRVEIYRDLTAQRVFQAKLLQTEKLAALGQMVTGIAHELSNPLTSILGYAQRLLVRKELAGQTNEARQIYEEAERASTILRQLLLNAREARPERKRVSLNQVVQRAMELQRFGSAAEKIRIELDLEPTLPFVTGDAGQLQQVLMNLIGNARQAIVQEGKAGTIRLRTARSGDRRAILQVIDDGPGIPQTILARIFDPFFTTKPEGVGTGLGLAIVLSVVREHGGQVSVSSPPEGGVIFTVELPLEAEAFAETGPYFLEPSERVLAAPHAFSGVARRPRSLPQPIPRSSHRGIRVLVVEDEPTVARLIGDVLEDEGLRVDVLLDGREALERASRERFDLVICDMKMPGLDGQHFYQSLARAGNMLQERFLFVTGDVIAQQTQEFLEKHRLPHVAKPFRVEELTEKVFSLLDSQLARGGRASAARKAH